MTIEYSHLWRSLRNGGAREGVAPRDRLVKLFTYTVFFVGIPYPDFVSGKSSVDAGSGQMAK